MDWLYPLADLPYPPEDYCSERKKNAMKFNNGCVNVERVYWCGFETCFLKFFYCNGLIPH